MVTCFACGGITQIPRFDYTAIRNCHSPGEAIGRRMGQDPELLRRLLRAKDRMDAASHEEWPVRRLAQVSGASEAHFARAFKEAFGVPPHRYLLTRRIERAVALLRDTDRSVTEIAFQTGWNSLGTFGRTFRNVTGENPAAIRERQKAAPNDLARVPECVLRAAHRPDLTIAVSEKRRREEDDTRGDRRNGGPMSQGIEVVGLYVRDQDEALAFYVEKLGFRVHTDVRNGDYRWLTVQHPDQPSFQLGLFAPGPPVHDVTTAQQLQAIVAKGAMPPLVLTVDDCRAAYGRMRAAGVEFTQEPMDRYGTVDAGFRDPSGNGWKMIQARR